MSEIEILPQSQPLDLIDTMSEYVGNEDSEIIKADNVASLPSSTRGDEGIIEGVTIVDHSNTNDDQLQYSSESNDEGEEGIIIHAGRNSVRKPAYRKSLTSNTKYYQRPDGLQSLSSIISVGLFNSSDNKANQGDEELKKLRFPRHVTAFDVDIHALDDHPWRNKSVDLSDFFNYGFNERSWLQYCEKQLRLRNQKGLGPYQPPERVTGTIATNVVTASSSAPTQMDIVSSNTSAVEHNQIENTHLTHLESSIHNSSPVVTTSSIIHKTNTAMESASTISSSVPLSPAVDAPPIMIHRAPPPPQPSITTQVNTSSLATTAPFISSSLKPPPPPPQSTIPPLNTIQGSSIIPPPHAFAVFPPPPTPTGVVIMPPPNFLKPGSSTVVAPHPMNMYGPPPLSASGSNPSTSVQSLLKDMYGPSRTIDYSKLTHPTNIDNKMQQPSNLLRDMYGPSTISNVHSSNIEEDKKYYSNKRNRDTIMESDDNDHSRRGYKEVDYYDMKELDARDRRRKTESSRSHREEKDSNRTDRSRDRGMRGNRESNDRGNRESSDRGNRETSNRRNRETSDRGNREASDRGNSRDRGIKDRGNIRDRGSSRDRGGSRDRENTLRMGDTSERSRKR